MKASAQDETTTTVGEEKQTDTRSEFDALLRSDTRAGPQKPARQPQPGLPAARDRAAEGALARIGQIASVDADGTVSVAVAGWANAVAARLATPLSAERIQVAMTTGQPVVLVFEEGDPLRPIIVGLIESQLDPAIARTSQGQLDTPTVIEADVDGKRLRITAHDEIVFECGQASVTLRRNGRIVIRGTHVESYSEGTNRIRGGQVRIN